MVLFQEGSKVMQLEGPDAAAVRVEELEDLLSEVGHGGHGQAVTLFGPVSVSCWPGSLKWGPCG